MTDPVADFLTRIRNALKADHDDVLIPSSRLNAELARHAQGARATSRTSRRADAPPAGSRPSRAEFDTLRVKLKYTEDREPVISGIKRVSKPGRRQYVDRRRAAARCWAAWARRSSRPRAAS